MVEISSDVIRGYNDTIILSILMREPSYGYGISRDIKEISDGKYVITVPEADVPMMFISVGKPDFLNE